MMVFAGDDVTGVELSSAFKNVVAIAAGIATEMDVGRTPGRCWSPRPRGDHPAGGDQGAAPHPGGPAGIGDLSDLRQPALPQPPRRGGPGEGERLPEILSKLGMVAEGYAAVAAATWRAGTTSRPRCSMRSTGCSTRGSRASRASPS
ncbi:MAG: hypothetical protein IPF99_37815 [Deltaproteobacteria bacterium]|nr:hypothetical protein [Deltaproteobacteria bacterium]